MMVNSLPTNIANAISEQFFLARGPIGANMEMLSILSARQILLVSHIGLCAATPSTWDQLAVGPPTPDVS